MRERLYTVHEKRRGKGSDGERDRAPDLRVVSDGFDLGAFLVPLIWAIWHGAWATLVAQVALLGAASLWAPLGPLVVALGISLVLGFEGASVRRAELRLRGWRQAGLVTARSAAGAEELYLKGETA